MEECRKANVPRSFRDSRLTISLDLFGCNLERWREGQGEYPSIDTNTLKIGFVLGYLRLCPSPPLSPPSGDDLRSTEKTHTHTQPHTQITRTQNYVFSPTYTRTHTHTHTHTHKTTHNHTYKSRARRITYSLLRIREHTCTHTHTHTHTKPHKTTHTNYAHT